MAKNPIQLHPELGSVKGTSIGEHLVRWSNIPYGTVPRRFARARLLGLLPSVVENVPFDATGTPIVSIQPWKSGEMDCKGNQLPYDIMDGYDEEQSEYCLRLNITKPMSDSNQSLLPVLVYIHGGAFFVGSGTRPYYDPTVFCEAATKTESPCVFVSLNYRLGGLGFFHSPEASETMPANNGLHDQLVGLEWIRRFIGGFGGDADDITVMGQSAGGMSCTIHNLSHQDNIWKRSIQMSGSLVTMPVQSPESHQSNFLKQAEKMGIATEGKTSEAIANDIIDLPVNTIRDAGYVGLPCKQTELLPYESASTATMTQRPPQSSNLDTQLVSSTTYDGGISYNLTISDNSRQNHAQTFIKIAQSVLKTPQALLDLYEIRSEDDDVDALRKICLMESDVGFFAPSLAQARAFPGRTYLLLFDLGNPFEGLLPAGQCATHTWDIVALLGACEGRLDQGYLSVIREFRERIIKYAVRGEEPWPAWTEKEEWACVVGRDGVRVVGREEYMGPETRRGKVLALAEEEAGVHGCDLLWDGLGRRFLMKGE